MSPSHARHESPRTLRGGGALSESEAFWSVGVRDEPRRKPAIYVGARWKGLWAIVFHAGVAHGLELVPPCSPL